MKMMKLIFFVVYLNNVLSSTTETSSVTTQCRPNETYYDKSRSPMCDANCQNLERPCFITTKFAVAGCYCRPGYARNLQQQCISQQECIYDCFINESHIAQFNTGCELTCATNKRICYEFPERRCVCSEGFCRNQSAQCVLK